MKRKLLGVLTCAVLLLICVGTASAADYQVSGGSIYITADGVVSSSTTTVTDVEIPETVNGITVTAIGKNAFKGRTSLVSVVIPETVTTIGADAFNGCSNLVSVTLPAGAVMENSAFSWCTKVAYAHITGTGDMPDFTNSYTWTPWYSGCYNQDHEVTLEIASGVTGIGAHTFHDCGKIVTATVPDTVTKIGASAFEGCGGLGSIAFAQYADEIGECAFKRCMSATGAVTVKDGITEIAPEAFRGCTSLQTLTLPASVKVIGRDAFNGCTELATVTYPAGAALENSAFSWCTKVTDVRIVGTGDMVDYTDSYTWTPWYSGSYYADHDLTLTIESGVTGVGAHTFHDSGKIVKATVADTVTKIGASAFEGCGSLGDLEFVQYADEIGQCAFKRCTSAAGTATVKDGMTAIAEEAFRGCTSLQTVLLPASVQVIEHDAFNGCSALEHVTLPAAAILENSAFSWCTAVNSVRYIGVGEMADYTDSYTWSPCYSGSYYADHEVSLEITSGVTSIGAHAFHGAGKLIDAQVPDTVTKIGVSAFEGCGSLSGMEFAQYADEIGPYAFKGCTGATGEVAIKDGVTEIASEAFRGCSSLQTLTLPESLKTVGQDAFNGCSALATVTYPAGAALENSAFSWCTGVTDVRIVGEGDMVDYTESYTWTPWFSGCYNQDHEVTLEIASGVTGIGAHTFHGCGKIVKATVPDTVTKIGASAFEGCSSLGDLEFAQYADEIGQCAFKGCSDAKGGVTIKDGVTAIAAEAFRSCSSLQTLTLPASVKNVGQDAFNGCSALEDVTLPGSLTLDNSAFSWCTGVKSVTFIGKGDMYDFTDSYTWTPWYSGCYYADHDVTIEIQSGVTGIGAHTFHGSSKIVTATVADTVTKIGASAFEGCSSLGDLSFARYADEIGQGAFKGCSGATGGVTIKDGVTEIAVEAFRGCSSLQTLTLPESVETIGQDAFNGCSSLQDVTFPAGAVMEPSAFSWCTAVSHVLFVGQSDMSDLSDTYTWSPWYSGCYYSDHDVSIDIAQGVTSVGKNAFRSCGRIQSVTIPLSVTRIDANAFYDCQTLDVYYAGTEAQWGGVSKTLSKKNPNTLGNTNLIMHYSAAPSMVLTSADGRTLFSQTYSAPANAVIFVIGYDGAGKMTESQSKTANETLSFTLSDTRTAKARILIFASDTLAPLQAPFEATV